MTISRKAKSLEQWKREAIVLYAENKRLKEALATANRFANEQRILAQRELSEEITRLRREIDTVNHRCESESRWSNAYIQRSEIAERENAELKEKLESLQRSASLKFGSSPLRMRSFGLLAFWREGKRSDV